MPEQSLRAARPNAPPIAERPPVAGSLAPSYPLFATVAVTAVAADQMYQALAVSSLTVLELIVLVLFVVLFAWVAFSSASALVGFVLSLLGPDRSLDLNPNGALPGSEESHALLVPT